MACISLQATSTDCLHTLFSPEREGRENGSIHNALKWKSRLISLSKGSNLQTEYNPAKCRKGEQPFYTSAE